MPRAPYTTTCDLYNGLLGAAPQGAIRSSGVCRVVPESFQLPESYPFNGRVAYITLEFDLPRVPFPLGTGTLLSYEWQEADMVAFPSGGSPDWVVIFAESVGGVAGGSYYRAHIAARWF